MAKHGYCPSEDEMRAEVEQAGQNTFVVRVSKPMGDGSYVYDINISQDDNTVSLGLVVLSAQEAEAALDGLCLWLTHTQESVIVCGEFKEGLQQ